MKVKNIEHAKAIRKSILDKALEEEMNILKNKIVSIYIRGDFDLFLFGRDIFVFNRLYITDMDIREITLPYEEKELGQGMWCTPSDLMIAGLHVIFEKV